MVFTRYLELEQMRPPVQVCFDHLYSEYLSLKQTIDDTAAIEFIENLKERRDEKILSWHNLYYFELILANYVPAEKLKSRIQRLRHDYRSVAGQAEYDEYLASKPPDLQTPPDPSDPPKGGRAHYEALLREDLKDLLGRIYMAYAILPVREERLTDLTWRAAKLCLASLTILLAVVAVIFFIPLVTELWNAKSGTERLLVVRYSDKLAGLTLFVVVITGAMGGFVSALRRIQTPRTEGDALYNLSLLFHGSKSVFVAPVSGSIFAILLYLMFTAGVLSGTFFPTVFTPGGKFSENTDVTKPAAKARTADDQGSEASPPIVSDASASQTGEPGTDVRPSPTPKPVPEQGMNVIDFLQRSGPAAGEDFALLIIWCFIAGFAERFVPDALDRLIANGRASEKR